MKSKISSFFEKNVGKLALSGIVFALALVVALTTVFVLNGKKLENKTTPPTNAETTIVPYNPDNWTDPGNYDTVNVATGDGFSGGDGSEADPYIISTARQLAGLSYLASTGGAKTYKYYKLGSDIDLLDHYWTPIGKDDTYYFNGSFDGDGYVISGMVIDINSSSTVFAGLFGFMNDETGETLKISNLGIEKSEINVTSSSYACAGGLVGASSSSLTITNSYNTGNVSALGTTSFVFIGGLVGESYSFSLTIENSYNSGNVSVTSYYAYAGGLVGASSSSSSSSLTITNSYNTGNVSVTSSEAYAGGLVGDSASSTISSFSLTIKNSYNTGSVSVESMDSYAYAGGFVGLSSSLTITNSYNTGNVSVTSSSSSSARAGGLGGRFAGFSLTITNSYNTGTVDASGLAVYKGGLVGQLQGGTKTIRNSYFDGDVFSGNMIGSGGENATVTASGKVSGLSALMKDKANYGSESFGTYTDDNSSTGSAGWSSESPWDFENVWGEDVFGTNNGYPVLRTKEYNDMLPLLDKHWKYNAATSYAGGDGTQSSPYLISTAQELALLSNDVNSGKFYDQETGTDKYIYAQLTDDIDLSGKYWNPIGQLNVMDMSGYTFVGSFDGNEHEIMNLEYDTSSLGMFVGVFGFVGKMDGQVNEKYNEIKNLGISGNDIELIFPSSSQIDGIGIAGIASYAIHTKIEDCYNKASITVDGAGGTVAGIVVAMSGEVKNCYNTGDLTMNIDIGDGNNSYNANVGGIVGGGGLASGNIDLISNCYNSGKLSAETFGYCMGFNINIGGISASWAGEIKNSYNIGDIYGQSNANETTPSSLSLGGVNGFIGSDLSLAIYNSFNIGQITGSYSGGTNLPENWMSNMNAKGGILGWKTGSSNLTITNSYFDSSKFSGRLVGKADRNDSNNDGTYEDTYSIISSGKVSGLSEKMRDKANYGVSSFGTYTDDSSSTGSAIWSSENPWDFAEVWMIEQGFNFEYPIFKTMKARMWKYDDNVLAITGFAGGLGTAESPYQISSAEELAYLSNLANQGNTMTHKYYELTADIDLSGKYWTPIGVFSSKYFIGSFNGNNHTVKNMSIEFFSLIDGNDQINIGLFGLAGSFSGKAVYKDLKILDSKILVNCKPKNGFNVGSFIGFTGINIEVNNIYVDGYISVETEKSVNAGGIIGNCQGTIQMNNLVSYADIDFQGSGTQCYAGGVIGVCVNNSNATLNNLVNVGNINSTGARATGGIIGNAYPSTLKLNKSFNVGSVHGNNYVGGLVGEMGSGNLSIDQCFNSGKVSTNNSSANVGGIAGNISGTATINNTFCTGDIQSPSGSGDYINPMVGSGTASITNSYYKLDMLNSSGGAVSMKKNFYDKGSSDSVAFDGNIWFYHADLNEGLPLLRPLFWAETSVAVQGDVYDKIVDYMAV